MIDKALFGLLGYIDPGAGLPFFSWLPFIIGILLGLLGGVVLFIKRFFSFFRRFLFLGILILIAGGIIAGAMMFNKQEKFSKKVVVIGMDGLDYVFTKKHIDKGELPHFKALKEQGTFSSLETVCPAESNVVWTSFYTGMNPGNHGIFDFIMRNPKNYLPFLSLTDISSEPKTWEIGPLKIPYAKPAINKRVKALAFWEITSKNKIPTHVYFCPNSFPADKVQGKLISGMGVPDIRGTMGTFSFYTTKPLEKDKFTGGIVSQVAINNGMVNTFLYGPRNTSQNPPRDIIIPLQIRINNSAQAITIDIQGKKVILKEKEWSRWLRLEFKVNAFSKIKGICKFYLKSITPDFELYCSPVNFNPQDPLYPLTYPKGFSKELVKEIGLFYTQGMPYDTWALNEERITPDIFLSQAMSVLEERERILKREFKQFKGGVFFYYFAYPDPIQHMFWNFQDTESSSYKDIVLQCYKKMDKILGWIRENIDEDTTLIVLSDHGFGSFNRAVHLNSWLKEKGFLCLKEGIEESKEFFETVDWSKTKAYALGFGGIYINQQGREGKGCVSSGEAARIKEEIIKGLSKWRDSQTESLVAKKVYTKEEAFSGKYNTDAPDLFVGFNLGYRASWQTALGAVPLSTLEDNTKAWRADHIFDPSLVDGVLFINKKYQLQDKPKIIDIVPTILKLLDIDYKKLDGKSLL